jgi:hypothetical protein
LTKAQALKRLASDIRLFKRKVGARAALVASRNTGRTLFHVGRGFPKELIPLALGAHPEHSPSIIYRPSSPHIFVASISEFLVLALALRSARQEPRAWLGFRHRKALLSGLAEVVAPSVTPDPPEPELNRGFGTVAVLACPRAVGRPA